jgi:hypothetical protein
MYLLCLASECSLVSVLTDAGWKQESPGSVPGGAQLVEPRVSMGSTQLSVEWLLGLKQLELRMHGTVHPFSHML